MHEYTIISPGGNEIKCYTTDLKRVKDHERKFRQRLVSTDDSGYLRKRAISEKKRK